MPLISNLTPGLPTGFCSIDTTISSIYALTSVILTNATHNIFLLASPVTCNFSAPFVVSATTSESHAATSRPNTVLPGVPTKVVDPAVVFFVITPSIVKPARSSAEYVSRTATMSARNSQTVLFGIDIRADAPSRNISAAVAFVVLIRKAQDNDCASPCAENRPP